MTAIFTTRTPNEADRLAVQELADEWTVRAETRERNAVLADAQAVSGAIDRLSKEIADLRTEKDEHLAFAGRCDERIQEKAKEREALRKEFQKYRGIK